MTSGDYSDAEVAAALVASSRHWSFRYEVLNNSGAVVRAADVVSAKIANNDLAKEIKRTGAFELPSSVAFDQLSERLRAYARLQMPDGGWFEWAVGTFHLSTSKTKRAPTSDERTVEFEAYDGLIVLVEDKVLDRYVVGAGINYRTAVTTLLASAGMPASRISSTTLTLPAAMEWAPGTSKLEIVNDLLGAINFTTLTMSPYGVPVAVPYLPPDSSALVWSYAIDRRSVIRPGIETQLDLFNVPNTWIAVVSEADRPELVSTLVNDDPASLTSTVNRGRSIVRVIENDRSTTEAADQTTLDARVRRVAEESSQQYEEATFTTGLMPFHESGDVCSLDYGDGPLRFREHSWSMELRAGGSMSHVFRRVVTI